MGTLKRKSLKKEYGIVDDDVFFDYTKQLKPSKSLDNLNDEKISKLPDDDLEILDKYGVKSVGNNKTKRKIKKMRK